MLQVAVGQAGSMEPAVTGNVAVTTILPPGRLAR
jgi:hypothetical protein